MSKAKTIEIPRLAFQAIQDREQTCFIAPPGDYQTGETLWFYDKSEGRRLMRTITHVFRGEGLAFGWAALSLF